MAEKTTKREWMFYAGLIIFVLFMYTRDKYARYRLKTEGKITKGVLIDIKSGYMGRSFYWEYLFKVGEKDIRGGYDGNKIEAHLNDSIFLVYLPSNPHNNAPVIDVFWDK